MPLQDEKEQKEKKFEKYAKEWQKHAVRFVFAFAFVSMIILCIVAACKRLVTKVCDAVCSHLSDWKDICLNRDPSK